MTDTPEEQELIIEQIEIGPMQNFTYLVGSRATREVVIVDPAWDIQGLIKHVAERDYTLKGALVTHYHPDHCGGSFGGHSVEGVSELLENQGMKVYVHTEEADGLKKVTGISDSDMVRVSSGDTLAIVEAMKMEHRLTAGGSGKVQEIRVAAGDMVDAGAVLLIVEYAAAEEG